MTTKKFIACLMGTALFLLLSAPAWTQNASASSSRQSSATINENNKEVFRWNSSDDNTDFNIEMRGKIELSDDDKDIKSISDDGYLEISKTVFGSKRSILIESLGGGQVKKEYYEGRTKMPWEPNGKAWLGEILPEVVRSSTIGSENRVNRLFKKGGTSAVLSEIGKLENDHVREHYGTLLMSYPVPAKDYPAVINTLSESIDSDHFIAEFLRKHAAKFIQQDEATSAMFTATEKMDSDHFKSLVISQVLNGTAISRDNLRLALQTAADMDSDHFITEVLTNLLKQKNMSDATLVEIINTTKTLESDHYRTMVLTNALDKTGLSDEAHRRIIESIKGMSSDHYVTQVIFHLMEDKLSDSVLSNVLDILSAVDSDHYRTEILKRAIDRQDMSEAQFARIMEVCGQMDSDHYKSIVLRHALSSSQSDNLTIAVLQTTKTMDSDSYISEVLLSAAPKVKNGNPELKNAYRSAVKNISSETFYDRALRAIEE
jgi:hypothetical protein